MSADGLRKAQALRVGQIVAAPQNVRTRLSHIYILFKCLEPVTTVTDADYDDPALSLLYKHSRMGEVRAGDPVVKGLKLIRGSGVAAGGCTVRLIRDSGCLLRTLVAL